MTQAPDRPQSGWPTFLASLNGSAVGTAIGLALTAAMMLNPIFVPPFEVVFGRTLFLAMVLLLAFAGARAWPDAWVLRWLPTWLGPSAAIVVTAPLATLLIYLFTWGGFAEFVSVPERISGFFWIASAGVVLGAITTLGANVRQRLAEARSQALQFELERSRLEKQAVDARLALLQAQIEPHFLFNTLANVQALVESNSPRAAEVLKSLIAYLRAAMPRLHDAQPTLGAELALVRAYLELMQMRMPDRLQFAIGADPALLGRRLPPMSLLTLVENAIRHGIDPSEQGGRIDVGAALQAGTLHLWVADTGTGMDPRAQPGTGLANLRARLQSCFGDKASLKLEERMPQGLRAEILIEE
jgi:signal transduction histidine kinase